MNMIVGAVRVNQVGYRTDARVKRAMVGNVGATTFQVIRHSRTDRFMEELDVADKRGLFPPAS